MKTAPILCLALLASIPALAGDSIWAGGNGNWSDNNWINAGVADSSFIPGNRAVINDACIITVDADTDGVAGLLFTADATIDGAAKLVLATASKAQTIEVDSGVAAKISAPIDGKARKTGYGSLETTADNYKTLTLSDNKVDVIVFEIETGTWIVGDGSTVHVQTPSTESETGWYYFQGEGGSYSDPTKGAYIVVTNHSTLMYSKGKSAPWTCFGPRNKKGHFELLVTDGSTFRTKSDDFRISSEQGGASDSYFKLRAEDSTVEIQCGLNGGSRNSNATKILEFVNSDVTFSSVNMKGPSSRNSVTFDGAIIHTRTSSSTFFNASERNNTVTYHTIGNGLTIDAAHEITLASEAIIDGNGGLFKTGSKKLTLAADYTYTGTTAANAGELVISGSVAGPLSVASGATMTVSSATQGAVPSVCVTGTLDMVAVPLQTASLTLAPGATLALGNYGNVITTVTGYSGATIAFDASGWPLDTALFTSSDAGFLAAMRAAVQAQLASGLNAEVENGSVYIHSANVIKEAVWTGLGADTNWTTAANWDANGLPNTGDWLRFTGSSNATNANDIGTLALQSVVFDAGSGPFAIGGSGGVAAPAWTNLSANTQTLYVPATASANGTTVHTAGDIAFAGGLDGSSAYKVFKSGAGTMAVSNVSWGGKLQIDGGKVAFDGFAASPLSDEANAIVIRNGALDAGGAPVTIQQDVQAGAAPVLQDGATLLNGNYTLTGPTGYLTTWPPSTVTIGEGATLNTSCQLFDNPATAGRRVLRIVNGGVFRSSTNNERHLASGNTADTAFVLDMNGGKALFQSGGYIYFGSRQSGRRYTEVHLSNGAYLYAQAELRLGDYDGSGGSNVFTMVDSVADVASFNTGVKTDLLLMEIRNSSITNKNFQIGAGTTADPAKHSVTFDGAKLVSKENNANWLKAANNTETACIHLASGGVTMEARHNVTVSAVMDGEGGLVKTGTKFLTLAAKQLYTGDTIVSNGTLVVSDGVSVAGAVVVANGGSLSVADAATTLGSFTLEEGGLVDVSAWDGGDTPINLFHVSGPVTLHGNMASGSAALSVKAVNGGFVVRYGRTLGTTVLIR